MLCPKCGSYVTDGSRSCPVCGAAITTGPQSSIQNNAQQNGYQQNGWQQNGYQQNGYQQNGYQQNGWQQNGYQQNGYQQNGWQQNGYQQNGFQQNGYQQNGYQQNGYQQNGWQQGGNRPYAANMPMKWFKFLIYFSLWAGGVLNILSAFSSFSRGSFLTVLHGVALLLVGAFDIFTRYRLAEFRRDGPVCLYICYAAPAIDFMFEILYMMFIRYYSLDLISNIVSLVVSGVFIALNYVYFSKRAHLFRN